MTATLFQRGNEKGDRDRPCLADWLSVCHQGELPIGWASEVLGFRAQGLVPVNTPQCTPVGTTGPVDRPASCNQLRYSPPL